MPVRIDWHPAAIDEVAAFDNAVQLRIRKALRELEQLDDARDLLLPYTGSLKGLWKLRTGDYRLVCRLAERDGRAVLIVYAAHRSIAYGPRGERTILNRR